LAADALVVGGGLAGAALAARLAEAGREIILLEREAAPHDKVCGEFLSREAVLYLNALGVDPLALGAARIGAVRLAAGRRVAAIDLPFPALSLSRRTLDAALLARAAELGADIRLGARVTALDLSEMGWRARLAGGPVVEAGAAFLATGKHDLRGWPRPAGMQPDLIGFKMHWRLGEAQASALSGHVELTLFPGGYAGLEAIENGLANLSLLVRRRRFAALGNDWPALLGAIRAAAPLLDERLSSGFPRSERPIAVYAIPYGHVARATPGPWRLGDQAAVIPSFSGDGMSIALHSARLAADAFLRGEDAQTYQSRMARDVAPAVRFAALLSMAAVDPLGAALIGAGARFLPGAMSWIAAATRVPVKALRRAGLEVLH
jgi:flavin-dependent dehydrogenase